MPPPPMPGRKPVLFHATGLYAVYFALSQAWQVFRSAGSISQYGLLSFLGTVAINGLMIVFSGWMIHAASSGRIRGAAQLKTYLWCAMLAYPFSNMVSYMGLHLPPQSLPEELLFFGAITDLVRYLVPIALLIWTARSRALRAYLLPMTPAAGTTSPS